MGKKPLLRKYKGQTTAKIRKNDNKSLFQKANSNLVINKVYFKTKESDKSETFETLEAAWNNLPTDFSTDERLIFLEIAEKVVRLHKRYVQSLDDEKN